jgi:hypothetical protein
MKLKLTLAGLTTAAVLLPAAYAQTTGTSHPEQLNDQITTAPNYSTAPHYVKPSPAIPAPPAETTSAPAALTAQQPAQQISPDDTYVGSTSPAVVQTAEAPQVRRPLTSANDPDANIITSMPDIPGQMNEGTMLYVQLQTPLSTSESRVGDTFLAALTQPVTQHGEVLLPIGSQIRGRISEVHGGRRFTGRASLRLQPESITLPDGSTRRLSAEVAGIGQFSTSHVDSEGAIIGDGHPKAALTAVAAATGGGALAGAVLGGGVGAVVGAGVGASLGTIWWLKRDVQQELPAGTRLILSLDQPLAISSTHQTAELAR